VPPASPLPNPQDLEATRNFLRWVTIMFGPRSRSVPVPTLDQVHVRHIEDGWVELLFVGYDPLQATALADALLLPDAVLVRHTDTSCTLQGFATLPDGPPPAPTPAARRPPGDAPPGDHLQRPTNPPQDHKLVHLESTPPPAEQ
jgi:hypothetical protein